MTEKQTPYLRDIYDLAVRTDAKIDALRIEVSGQYISRQEFEPIKRIVYGLVTTVLFAVVMALVALLIKN